MDKGRLVSSAGYRLPDRTNGTRPLKPAAVKPSSITHSNGVQYSPNSDPVKQDQIWRDFVHTEIRGVKEWEKNWSFLKNYDQMGNVKEEQPLPSYMELFSAHIPNTTNHTFGSRTSTPLGMDILRMDRLLVWTGSHHKSKPDAEMLPC